MSLLNMRIPLMGSWLLLLLGRFRPAGQPLGEHFAFPVRDNLVAGYEAVLDLHEAVVLDARLYVHAIKRVGRLHEHKLLAALLEDGFLRHGQHTLVARDRKSVV